MRTSQAGIDLQQHFEDCRLEAYPDPKTGGDPWTIGWGHTGPEVHKGLVWTQQKADQQFELDVIERGERHANQHVAVPLTQGQYDAMVSILMNVGPGNAKRNGIIRLKDGQPSTLLRLLNSADYAGAAEQFLRWISPGSDVENGLRRRRNAERALFLGKDWRAYA